MSFEGADLRDADFTGARLARVDLRSADLTGARLPGWLLKGATKDACTRFPNGRARAECPQTSP